MIKLELNKKKNEIWVKDPADVTSLQNGFYGEMKHGDILLNPEEVL